MIEVQSPFTYFDGLTNGDVSGNENAGGSNQFQLPTPQTAQPNGWAVFVYRDATEFDIVDAAYC